MPALKTKNIEESKTDSKLHGTIMFVQINGKYHPIGVWNSNKRTIDFQYSFKSDVWCVTPNGESISKEKWKAEKLKSLKVKV
jgi:hypothetical protein